MIVLLAGSRHDASTAARLVAHMARPVAALIISIDPPPKVEPPRLSDLAPLMAATCCRFDVTETVRVAHVFTSFPCEPRLTLPPRTRMLEGGHRRKERDYG
jgi:hypothetical protein